MKKDGNCDEFFHNLKNLSFKDIQKRRYYNCYARILYKPRFVSLKSGI